MQTKQSSSPESIPPAPAEAHEPSPAFDKLKFPSQKFVRDIGVEKLPERQRPFDPGYVIPPSPDQSIERRIPATLIHDTIKLAKAVLGEAPADAEFNSSGQAAFVTNGRKYLASPDFVLREGSKEKVVEKYQPQIEKLQAEIAESKKEQLPVKDLQEYYAQRRELIKSAVTLFKENGKANAENDFIRQADIEKLPEEARERYDKISEAQTRLENAFVSLKNIEGLQSKHDRLQKLLQNSDYFEGTLADGTNVNGFRDDIGYLELNDSSGAPAYQARYWTRTTIRPDGERIEKEGPPSWYPDSRSIEYKGGANGVDVVENYAEGGRLLNRHDRSTGIIDRYSDGTYSSSELAPGGKEAFFNNLARVQQHPQSRELVLSAVRGWPERVAGTVSELKRLPYYREIIEESIAPLTEETLAPLQAQLRQLEDGPASAERLNSAFHKLSDADRREFAETVDFRMRMLHDGTVLSRETGAIQEFARTDVHLWNDPHSRGYFEIDDSWIDWSEPMTAKLVDPENADLSKKELKLIGARMLSQQEEELTPENLRAALHDISELREKYGSVELFKGRNVIVGAHSDTLADYQEDYFHELVQVSGDDHQFAKPALLEGIMAQQAGTGSLNLFRADFDRLNNPDRLTAVLRAELPRDKAEAVIAKMSDKNTPKTITELRKSMNDQFVGGRESRTVIETLRGAPEERVAGLHAVKDNILEAIRSTPGPLTFVFDGHGGPDSLYLSDGLLGADTRPQEFESTTKITVDELAAAFNARAEKFGAPSDPAARDVLILQACYNHNFIDKLNNRIDPAAAPISIGASEYNQLSVFSLAHPAGAPFLSETIGAKPGVSSDLKSVIGRQLKDLSGLKIKVAPDGTEQEFQNNTNPSIYVPDRTGKPRQISALMRPDGSFA